MIEAVAISTRDLVKRYGRKRALDGFSLDVPKGAVFGVVGANGAGKTTWMLTVAGFLRADSGRVWLLGNDGFDARLHAGRVAVLPQDSELPLEAHALGLLRTFARLQGLPGAAAEKAALAALEAVHLADRRHDSVRSLSHGMRKRLMVAQCFLGDPEVVLLDEPMNGLDPGEAERMRSLILGRRGERTVVISSHNLLDLERLCTHVAFVAAGKVVCAAPLAELKSGGESLEDLYRRHIGQA